MKRLTGLFFALIIILTGSAFAQELNIIVQAEGVKKMKIAMPVFEGPEDAVEPVLALMRKDIEISGVFELIDPKVYLNQGPVGSLSQIKLSDYALIGADFIIVGSVSRVNDVSASLRIDAVEAATGKVVTRWPNQIINLNAPYGGVHDFMDRFLKDSLGLGGIFQSRIVCVQQKGNTKTPYVCWSDGSGGQPIIRARPGDISLSPVWSRDGSKIAFVSYARKNPDLYIYQSYPSAKVTMVSSSRGLNSAPAFHPSGQKLALTLTKDGNPDIYEMDLRSRRLKRLTASPAIDTSAFYSPDGSSIIYSSGDISPQIYRMSSAGGSTQRLTFQGGKNTEPVFSPRGDMIAFTQQGSDGRFRIAVMNVETPGAMKVLHPNTTMDEVSPSFSPDGRLLVFDNMQGSIFICDLYGSVPVKISGGDGKFSQPSWGPLLPQ